MGNYHDSTGVYRRTTTAVIPLAFQSLDDGTALAAFADGASPTPGLAVDNSEAAGIRWNNHATPTPVAATFPVPTDRKPGTNMTLVVLASKSGATLADAVTFTVAAFGQPVSALHDADANFGGASSAMTGDAAAKTVQKCTLALASADIPAAPANVTLTLQPTDGTLGTDDVTVHKAWLEYEKIVNPAS